MILRVSHTCVTHLVQEVYSHIRRLMYYYMKLATVYNERRSSGPYVVHLKNACGSLKARGAKSVCNTPSIFAGKAEGMKSARVSGQTHILWGKTPRHNQSGMICVVECCEDKTIHHGVNNT